MERSATDTAPLSPDWLIRPFELSMLAPAWLGLGFAIAWLGIVGLAHTAAHIMIGPAALPVSLARFASTFLLDAALLGLLLAGHAHLYLGAVSDLHRLRPLLPDGDADFERLTREVPSLARPTRTAVTIIGIVIDVTLIWLTTPDSIALRWIYVVGGVVMVGVASGYYIGAGLGPGPRDGLMTGLARRGWPIGLVRMGIELVVLFGGWLLGGTVGVGTLLFAFGIGPLVQVFLPMLTVRPASTG